MYLSSLITILFGIFAVLIATDGKCAIARGLRWSCVEPGNGYRIVGTRITKTCVYDFYYEPNGIACIVHSTAFISTFLFTFAILAVTGMGDNCGLIHVIMYQGHSGLSHDLPIDEYLNILYSINELDLKAECMCKTWR
ncbi:hypothetical protein P154DRAFT_580438 [Amniculicola lignicola CBS 123094]|uniref:F-box domain-containing protein n=1 Tax=Amniculicola lignicola CBS 123094 TaxID=1392246 RepID=A0A6A5W3V1_9PLEO|nr:hypothetical protein P154DRAFT_580438 [Amniculicola lignicola CBS 123094]